MGAHRAQPEQEVARYTPTRLKRLAERCIDSLGHEARHGLIAGHMGATFASEVAGISREVVLADIDELSTQNMNILGDAMVKWFALTGTSLDEPIVAPDAGEILVSGASENSRRRRSGSAGLEYQWDVRQVSLFPPRSRGELSIPSATLVIGMGRVVEHLVTTSGHRFQRVNYYDGTIQGLLRMRRGYAMSQAHMVSFYYDRVTAAELDSMGWDYLGDGGPGTLPSVGGIRTINIVVSGVYDHAPEPLGVLGGLLNRASNVDFSTGTSAVITLTGWIAAELLELEQNRDLAQGNTESAVESINFAFGPTGGHQIPAGSRMNLVKGNRDDIRNDGRELVIDSRAPSREGYYGRPISPSLLGHTSPHHIRV